LADPAPIAYTLLSEAVLRHHFRLSGIITTVDAVNGAAQLDAFPEAVKQASMADRHRGDQGGSFRRTGACGAAQARLRALNVSAQFLESSEISGEVHRLLTDDIYDADGKFREASHWTAEEVDEHGAHEHTADVQSFAAIFDRPLDWTAFGVWASMLLHRHGADVLRLKGLLNVAGVPTPGSDQRGSAHRPSAEPFGTMAGLRPALASHIHRARVETRRGLSARSRSSTTWSMHRHHRPSPRKRGASAFEGALEVVQRARGGALCGRQPVRRARTT
jgi:G3E family GTPase